MLVRRSVDNARLAHILWLMKDQPPEERKQVSLIDHLRQVDPGPHLDWWHVGAMIEAIQALGDGEIENLAFACSPRTFKSRVSIQGASSWMIRNDPRRKIMVSCASIELVNYHSGHAQEFAKRAGVMLKTKSVAIWQTSEGGAYRAVTILGGPFGFGWDFFACDDPFGSIETATSRLLQLRTWNRWHNDFQTRKQARPCGRPAGQLIMHQRLAPGDVIDRLIGALEEGLEEQWHALIIPAFREAQQYSLPVSVVRLPDPRKPGEPLCDDANLMRPIEQRRASNPQLHQIVDQQRPPKDFGGGLFRRSWMQLVGAGRDDLGDQRAALEAMVDAGELATVIGWYRGHDFSAGGADATCDSLLAQLEPSHGIEFVHLDMGEAHPPAAMVEGTALSRAMLDDKDVVQVIPIEPGTGKVLSESLALKLRALGYKVVEYAQLKNKRVRATPHAGAAAPHCRGCGKVVVGEDEEEGIAKANRCTCEAQHLAAGRVAVLAGPQAGRFREQHHDFSGEEGGADDYVDAASGAYNAAVSGANRGEWGLGGGYS